MIDDGTYASFEEAVGIIERSRNEILDESEMGLLYVDGEYKFGISSDADVLIHENWHSFQEESGPAYIYGLHLVRGFEALLVDMGIEANGPGGIVLLSLIHI